MISGVTVTSSQVINVTFETVEGKNEKTIRFAGDGLKAKLPFGDVILESIKHKITDEKPFGEFEFKVKGFMGITILTFIILYVI